MGDFSPETLIMMVRNWVCVEGEIFNHFKCLFLIFDGDYIGLFFYQAFQQYFMNGHQRYVSHKLGRTVNFLYEFDQFPHRKIETAQSVRVKIHRSAYWSLAWRTIMHSYFLVEICLILSLVSLFLFVSGVDDGYGMGAKITT